MKKLALSFMMMIGFTSLAQAEQPSPFADDNSVATPCSTIEGQGDEALLRCYLKDFDSKYKSNQIQANTLLQKTKTKFTEAAKQKKDLKVDAYAGLARKISRAVSTARTKNLRECAEIGAKFKDENVSAIASVNCRTSREVSLTKELNKFEQDLETIEKGRDRDRSLLSLSN